jgi:hypothetical protein
MVIMDADTEEFFIIVGKRSKDAACHQMVEITITNRNTGEVVIRDLRVKCGIWTTDTSDNPGLECRSCERFMVPCDCGVTAAIGLDLAKDPSIPICAPDICLKHTSGGSGIIRTVQAHGTIIVGDEPAPEDLQRLKDAFQNFE